MLRRLRLLRRVERVGHPLEQVVHLQVGGAAQDLGVLQAERVGEPTKADPALPLDKRWFSVSVFGFSHAGCLSCQASVVAVAHSIVTEANLLSANRGRSTPVCGQ